MSLEKILQAIETEAESHLAKIEQETQAQLEQIRAQAQAEGEAAQQKRLTAVQAPLQVEQTRLLNQARLKALQTLLATREELIAAVLQAAAQKLAALPSSRDYPGLLRQLTQETVDTLGRDQRLSLRVQRADLALMNQLVQEMGLTATVEAGLELESLPPESGLGGLVATTADGRISLDNTLAVRLQRVAGHYRAQIAQLTLEPPED